VDATQPDAHKPNQPVITQTMTTWLVLEHCLNQQDLEAVLRRQLKWLTDNFERHEAHEFLKMDGKCITDPHPDGPDGPPA